MERDTLEKSKTIDKDADKNLAEFYRWCGTKQGTTLAELNVFVEEIFSKEA